MPSKKSKKPKMEPMNKVSDKRLKEDILKFVDGSLISTTEAASYSLALLYSSLDDKDKKILAENICAMSRELNEFFNQEVSDKKGTSLAFMYSLLYMLANMHGTLLQDEHWQRLTAKGMECKMKYLEQLIAASGKTSGKKPANDIGYC